MRYFSLFILFFLSIIHSLETFSADFRIIPRSEWGADESLRYADSPVTKNMYSAYLQYVQSPKTQAQLDAIKLGDERVDVIEKTFGNAGQITSLRYSENGHPLVVPLEKVKQVSRIIIHHEGAALDKDETDEEMIRRIYKSHVNKQWGDIAYNYIIGQRGKIYEGRAGGDYVVGTHALYNNRGSVGIVILGDYTKNQLNRDQIAGLENLIPFLAKKYGITLSKIANGVECTNYACDTLEKITSKSLLGHRDVRATDCPGENVYPFIQKWIKQFDTVYAPVYNPESINIESIPTSRIMNLTLKKETVLPKTPNPITLIIPKTRYIGPKFRVKLSYPDAQNIIIASADGFPPKLVIGKTAIPVAVSQKIQLSVLGDNRMSVKMNNTIYSGAEVKLTHGVLRIDSWNRVPDWDKSGKYNDNLFRDTIRVINQKGKLVVINDLPLEWYLKGLGEVSNGDLSEKVKTIIVAARSYAKYYMDPKNRKFGTSLYDGSDNPDEFQKYLGYGYESRSPIIAKLVDATRGQVITYKGSIVKAWYHSSSDGRTLSALEYCQKNGSTKCSDIPYLQSVADPGSVGNKRSGHGVGISGAGATYWAKENWNYKQIIQYYLQGVEIQKK